MKNPDLIDYLKKRLPTTIEKHRPDITPLYLLEAFQPEIYLNFLSSKLAL